MAISGLGDIMTSLSPLAHAGIDPDEALASGVHPEALLAARRAQAMRDPTAPTIAPTAAPRAVPAAAPKPAPALSAGMGAASPVSPARSNASRTVPASVSPSGNTDYYNSGMSGALATAARERQMAEGYGSQPDATQTIAPLEQERSKLAAPTPLYGPDGKMLQQYRPGIGRRILRGVGAFAIGGVPAALDPQAFHLSPYGAPNARYGTAEENREAQLNAVGQQIKDDEATTKDDTDRMKAIMGGMTSADTGFGNVVKGANDQQKNQIDQQNANTKQVTAQENSPQGKADAAAAVNQKILQQRTLQANSQKLTGRDRAYYILTGKLPPPHYASAQEIADNNALQAFRREHGRYPNSLDEVQEVYRAAKGGNALGNVDQSAVDAIVANATQQKQNWADGYKRNSDGTGSYENRKTGKSITAQQFADKIDSFRTGANQHLARYGYQIDNSGNVIKVGDTGSVAPKESAPQPGETRTYKGHQYKFDGKEWRLQ